VNKRLARIAQLVGYPLFYLFSLALFGYLSFPYEKLSGRIIAEFDKSQEKKKRRGGTPMRLEIDDLDSYWFSGVEITGARLIMPPKRAARSPMGGFGGFGGSTKGATGSAGAKNEGADEAPKATVMKIDRATARVRLLPLLLGDVVIDFSAEAFGGEVEGHAPWGAGEGDVEVEISGLQLSEVTPLKSMLEGMPVLGVVNGSFRLTPKEGKFAKGDGKLELRIDDVLVGDGKTKVQGFLLPAAQAGNITIDATAADGVLTVDEMSAHGRDFELTGEGKIKLSESWDRSLSDVYLKFKFTDAYKDKNDATRGLFAAIEVLPMSPFKRAKTDDGYYRFQLAGTLANLDFKPAGKPGAPASARGPAKGRGGLTMKGARNRVKAPPADGEEGDEGKTSDAQEEGPPKEREAPKEEGEGDSGE
jgi:type II secretion system protein N